MGVSPHPQRNLVLERLIADAMTEHGWTKRASYAAAIGVDPSTVRRYLRGAVVPSPAVLRRMFRVHHVESAHQVGFPPGGATHAAVTGLEDHMAELLRREALGLAGVAMLGGTVIGRQLDPIRFPAPSRPVGAVGAAEITSVVQTHTHIHRMGQVMGGGVLDPDVLLRQFEANAALLHGTFRHEEQRRDMHDQVVLLASTIGWNLHDHGHHEQARRVWILGLDAARYGNHAAVLQSNILANMGRQAVDLRRPHDAFEALGLITARERELSPMARSQVHLVRAVAAGQAGDLAAMREYTRLAEDLLDRPSDRDLWNVSNWYDRGEIDSETGHALASAALVEERCRDEALHRLGEALRTYASTEQRSRARAATRIVDIHAARQDRAATVDAGRDALAAVSRIESPRVLGELVRLRPALRPMRRDPQIAELDRDIAALGAVAV